MLLPSQPTTAILAVLGRPNFECAFIANALRGRGVSIPFDARAEQGCVLFYLLWWAINHPDDWHKLALADLDIENPDTGVLGRANRK